MIMKIKFIVISGRKLYPEYIYYIYYTTLSKIFPIIFLSNQEALK